VRAGVRGTVLSTDMARSLDDRAGDTDVGTLAHGVFDVCRQRQALAMIAISLAILQSMGSPPPIAVPHLAARPLPDGAGAHAALPQRSAAQRVDGAARIAYRRDEHGRTRLADLFQRAPCRVLFPDVEAGEPPQAVLLTTSGGLTGGDRLRIDIDIGVGASATIATQAAEKLYRARREDEDTRIAVNLKIGRDAWAEWLAQETILFEQARLRRLLVADVEPGGRLLAVESVVFGRTAMQEDCRHGLLHDAWRIRRDGRLIWADALHLAGDIGVQRERRFGFGTARSCATLIYVGHDAGLLLEGLREQLQALPVDAAATLIDGVLIVRLLAEHAQALRESVSRVAAQLRHRAAGYAPHLPRVWTC